MMNAVEEDEFDIQRGVQSVWAIAFGILYLMVMVTSIILYMLTIRAVAKNGRRENVTYFLIFFLFFAALVEFALIIEEFMSRFGLFLFTTSNCRLFTYTVYGNRILQAAIVVTMLYYNLLAVYLKATRFQLLAKRFFPLFVLSLLLLEMALVLKPTLNTRASIADQWCELIEKDTRVTSGWLYSVLLPYYVPMLATIGPAIYLALRLKEEQIVEPQQSQVRVCLAVVAGYFLFYLMYFILMTAKQVESVMLERSAWNKLLGLSVWFIARRPMFTLIGHAWHVMVPLACLTLDKELRTEFPGRFLVKQERDPGEDDMNSISLETRNFSQNASKEVQETEMSPTFSALMLENREFHHNYPSVH